MMTNIILDMKLAKRLPGVVKMDELRDFLRRNGVVESVLINNDLRVLHNLLEEINRKMVTLKKGHVNVDEQYDARLEEAPQRPAVFMTYRMINIDIFNKNKTKHLVRPNYDHEHTISGKMRSGQGFFDFIPRIIKDNLDIGGVEGWNDKFVYPVRQYELNNVVSKEYPGIILSHCHYWNYLVILRDDQFSLKGYNKFSTTGRFDQLFVWETIADWESRKNQEVTMVEDI